MSPTADAATGFFRPDQPVADLTPSTLNPRKAFDDADLAELAESMKGEAGVIEPIVARMLGDRYEIVCGERRWRAAQKAGLKTVPVIVKRLTDAQALEVMVIENDQRKDVTALERAHGYAALMKADPKYADRKLLAEKIGRSLSWVHAAMKLLDLIPAAQKALLGGAITEGHAIHVARLTPPDQKRALDMCARGETMMSVRNLARFIEQQIHRDLHSAPFKKDDAALLPEAGPCTTCPKRSGSSPLFADIKKDSVCTDGACFQRKLQAFTVRKVEQLAAGGQKAVRVSTAYYIAAGTKKALGDDLLGREDWREAGKKACPHTVTAVVAHADRGPIGETLKVCTRKTCAVHNPSYDQPQTASEKRWKAQQQAKQKKRALERAVRSEILIAIRDKVGEARTREALATDDVKLIAVRFLHEMHADRQKEVYLLMGWPTPTKGKNTFGGLYGVYRKLAEEQIAKAAPAAVAQFLMVAALSSTIQVGEYGSGDLKLLQETARRWRVDAAAIEKRERAAAAKPGVQTSAPKKSVAKKKR